MTRKNRARYGLSRTYKINPTAKALRSALLLGLSAAAVAPSANADCVRGSSIQNVTCSGNFTNTLDSGIGDELHVLFPEDPTVIVLDDTTRVDTASESAVDARNIGDFTLINYGNLFSENAVVGDSENPGLFYATGNVIAFQAESEDGELNFTNHGEIRAENENLHNGSFDATGVSLFAFDGVTATNNGLIAGRSRDSSYGSLGNGIGLNVRSRGFVDITNSVDGKIYGRSYNSDAYGILAFADGDVDIVNDGLIEVHADEELAVGVDATISEIGGDITVTNSGSIDVISDTWVARGVYADDADSFTMENSGTVDVTGRYAEGIVSDNIDLVSVTNYGQIIATATGGSQPQPSIGVEIRNVFEGEVTVANYGDILVNGGSRAAGVSYSSANGDDGYGSVVINNAGSIIVGNTDGANWFAFGTYVDATGDIVVNNTGTFDSYGDLLAGNIKSYGAAADGIHAESTGGNVSVTNSGYILAESSSNNAYGIDAESDSGDVFVENFGDIHADASADAYGIYAQTISGKVEVVNGGFVLAKSDIDSYAIYADSESGDVSVTNSQYGKLVADAQDNAIGIEAYSEDGAVSVINDGSITVTALGDRADGIKAGADNSNELVSVTNGLNGEVSATSVYGSLAVGVIAQHNGGTLQYGGIAITNAGSITSTADYGSAFGVQAFANDLEYYADITITNSGSIDVSGANSVNAAERTVLRDRVVGIYADADDFNDYGSIVINNSGTIGVNSQYGDVAGIRAFAFSLNDESKISLSNSGTITASSDYGVAIGVVGEVSYMNDYGMLSVANTGSITTTGVGARGIDVAARDVSDYGSLAVSSTGTITVTATGDRSLAFGIGAVMSGPDGDNIGFGGLGIQTAGTIAVTAQGDFGTAYGVDADMGDFGGYGDIMIANGAKLTVEATGDYGTAFGINAVSADGSGISITNTGDIWANASSDYGDAFGIFTQNGADNTVITNSGSIKASAADDKLAWAISHQGGEVSITNAATGKIFGTIQTGAADDSFTNAGKWYATEGGSFVSDFGAGDDSIVNAAGGMIYMEDSVISLGSSYGSVNSFMNNGKLYADGDANLIDMGGNGSVFTNNGNSIHMEDGAADDQLTIFGDFAGTGHIVVDADGTSMLADRLYIDGDVVTNTANVIDVFMDAYPSLQDMIDGEEIDVVEVSGTSLAANFNLGDVTVAEDSLFSVDVSLIKDINPAGTNDLFSLGFEISGLTPTGVAASSIAPAVQSLWHLGTGTMSQRQGVSRDGKGSTGSAGFKGFNNAMEVADYQGASGVWLRAFTEDGSVNPEVGRGNFGMGGSQGFDLKNTGIEFGAGYAFNEQWTAGLLGGTSESTLRPDIGGRAKVDADTFGGYVTYTPGNGFYADFSYRNMDFDGNGNAGGDDFRFKGDADGYSLELGYGFKTASGLVVEPQFQYSMMDVNLSALDYAQGDFELTDGDSSLLRAGVALRKTFQAGSGEWTPYAALSFVNETDASNSYLIGGVLTGNVDTSGNSTLVEAGATAHYGNMVFSGGVNWKDGGAYDSLFGGQVSVRFTW